MQKLKTCKKCGTQMDTSAKTCPNCGAPAKGKKGWIIAAIIAAIIVIPAIAGGSNSEEKPVSNEAVSSVSETSSGSESVSSVSETSSGSESVSSVSETSASGESVSQANENKPESKEETDNNTFHIGDTLDTGKVKVTFQSAEDYVSDNEFITPEDGNKYIRAYFIVENTGDSDIYTSQFDFNCFADDSAADVPLLSEKGLTSGSVSPGRKSEGYVYFEIPKNSKKVEIEYETSFWTQEKAIFIVSE